MENDKYVGKDTDFIRFEQISNLPDNWNGYGAKSFSSKIIEKCKEIFVKLPVAPSVFPTGRQSIQFQYELPDRSYLGFEIFEEKITSLFVPERKYNCAETKEFTFNDIEQIKEMVIKFHTYNQ